MAINPLQQPINYSAQMVDLTPAFKLAGEGIEAFKQSQQDRAKQEEAAAIKAQYAKDLQETISNPTQSSWAQLIAKYPNQREAFAEASKMYGQERIDNEFNEGAAISMALENGRTDIALPLVQRSVEARKASGQPPGSFGLILKDLEAGNIKGAQANVNAALAFIAPEKFDKIVKAKTTAETAPDVVKKSAADATTAATAAKFGESQAVKDLALKDAQIQNYAVQQDIARQNARIAAMQAEAAKEGNALKRQELQLKIDTAQEARDQSVRDKYSQAQNVLATFDNTLVTVDKILNNWGKTKDGKIDPNLSNTTVKSATGPVQSRIFTSSQDVADFEEQVGSLESQAFLSQVEKMRGLGALTEREGARLSNALASLNLRQSPKQLAENLLIVKESMQKARESAAAKYGNLQSEPTAPAAPAAPAMPAGFRRIP
jgi:hypothetical protein